jgi:hypothetical protein
VTCPSGARRLSFTAWVLGESRSPVSGTCDVTGDGVARTGRPKAELVLTDEERAALEGWVRRRSSPQAWALRCRIILARAAGATNKDVAAQVGSTPQAVGRWRARFVAHRIAGLGDMPRSGAPRTVSDEQVAAVIAKTLESAPKDATHWISEQNSRLRTPRA